MKCVFWILVYNGSYFSVLIPANIWSENHGKKLLG